MKKSKLLLMILSLFVLSLATVGCDNSEPAPCVKHAWEVSVSPAYETVGELKCKNCVETKVLPALKDIESYNSSTRGETSYTVTYVDGDASFDFEQSYYIFEDINASEVALKEILSQYNCVINIPSEYNGKKVVKINYSAFETARTANWDLYKIVIPSTVNQIEGNVLEGLTWINTAEPTTLEFPLNFTLSDLLGANIPTQINNIVFNSGNVIKADTLLGCNISSFEIPKTVTKIEQDAFKFTENISYNTAVYYNGTVSDWCDIEFENECANPLFDGGVILLKNSNNEWQTLEKLVIPETITTIKDYAFVGSKINKVVISNSVEYLGEYAFKNCNNLSMVILGNGIKNVVKSPFLNAHQVEDIYFLGTPEELKTLRDNADVSSGETVFETWRDRETYYYSKTPNLNSGSYDYWYYDGNGEPNVWDIKYQDYYFGKDKYIYLKTEVEITNEAWNELVSKKNTAELNALLSNNTSVIDAFNQSASKEEFKLKVEELFTISNANFEIQFGKTGVIDYFTDNRNNTDYNFKAVSVEGEFGAYSYDYNKLYLTEIEEGVISVKEQGYIININHVMNID